MRFGVAIARRPECLAAGLLFSIALPAASELHQIGDS
jgi:hypothetical protein